MEGGQPLQGVGLRPDIGQTCIVVFTAVVLLCFVAKSGQVFTARLSSIDIGIVFFTAGAMVVDWWFGGVQRYFHVLS